MHGLCHLQQRASHALTLLPTHLLLLLLLLLCPLTRPHTSQLLALQQQ
jgi:hypothetical protein